MTVLPTAPRPVAPTGVSMPMQNAGPSLITAELLGSVGGRKPDTWAAPLAAACAKHAITTPLRIAAFLANVMHETGDFTVLVENLDYSAAALTEQWPAHFTPATAAKFGRTATHPADQRNIAELAYGGRYGNRPAGSGDGWLYRGRGLMQLTFRANYQAQATACGMSLAEMPAWLETPEGACESAARFWTAQGCNPHADAGDIDACRVIVNGALGGIEDVRRRYLELIALLAPKPVITKPVVVAATVDGADDLGMEFPI